MRLSGWTLLLQVVNFLVLLWLLRRFLWKPVQAVLERRRAEVERAAADAAAARQAAAALQAELEAARADLAKEREAGLASAHAQAEAERAATLARARAELEATQAEARARLEQEREEAVAALRAQASELAVALAGRLLGAAGPHALEPFLDRALARLAELPPAQRRALWRGPSDGEVRAVTASRLDEAARGRLREALARLVGEAPALAFEEEPALVAGVELHFPRQVLRFSWRDALAEAREEMARDADASGQAG